MDLHILQVVIYR